MQETKTDIRLLYRRNSKYNLSHNRVETGRKLVNLEETDYYKRWRLIIRCVVVL